MRIRILLSKKHIRKCEISSQIKVISDILLYKYVKYQINILLAGKAGDKMDMSLEIRPESGFLHVDVMGEFSLQEAKRTFLEMLEAVAQHQVEKVLLDGQRLKGDPTTMERFYYGEFAADAVRQFEDRGVSVATQFAYVLQEPQLDPQRFGETVAVNRGMFVKAFDNLEDALEWLGIAPANKPDAGDA
jgi:hypothetical protein